MISDGRFTHASDVWAFGIVAWELYESFKTGQENRELSVPYHSLDNNEEVKVNVHIFLSSFLYMDLASLKQTTRSSTGLSNFCKICGGVGEVERATGKETIAKQSFVLSLSRLLQVDSIVLFTYCGLNCAVCLHTEKGLKHL